MIYRLVLKKEDLDDAFKDKKFPDSAKVELLFERDRERTHGKLLFHVHICLSLLFVSTSKYDTIPQFSVVFFSICIPLPILIWQAQRKMWMYDHLSWKLTELQLLLNCSRMDLCQSETHMPILRYICCGTYICRITHMPM